MTWDWFLNKSNLNFWIWILYQQWLFLFSELFWADQYTEHEMSLLMPVRNEEPPGWAVLHYKAIICCCCISLILLLWNLVREANCIWPVTSFPIVVAGCGKFQWKVFLHADEAGKRKKPGGGTIGLSGSKRSFKLAALQVGQSHLSWTSDGFQ